jgi:hypothetical protein
MSHERIRDWLMFVFALPIYLVWGLVRYASLGKGWVEKIGMFIAFVPGIVIFSIMWGTLWAMALHVLWRIIT